jgi:hypothetical protein
MTREELVEIMERNLDSFMATDTDGCGYPIVSGDTIEKCADIILAAIAKEREGEVVLGDGKLEYDNYDFMVSVYDCPPGMSIAGAQTRPSLIKNLGKRGQLIFRPAKGDR